MGMGSRQRVPGRAVQRWEPCVVMEPMGVGTPPFVLQPPPKWRAPGPAYGGCIWHGKGLCEGPGRRAVWAGGQKAKPVSLTYSPPLSGPQCSRFFQ